MVDRTPPGFRKESGLFAASLLRDQECHTVEGYNKGVNAFDLLMQLTGRRGQQCRRYSFAVLGYYWIVQKCHG